MARFGLPVFSYPAVTGALAQMYHGAGADPQAIISDGAGLPAGARGPALWLAYMGLPGIERARGDLAAQGYRRVGGKRSGIRCILTGTRRRARPWARRSR